jgi:lipoyl(octanoyl) transferase
MIIDVIKNPVDYSKSYDLMQKVVNLIVEYKKLERIVLLEHFDVYTIGASGNEKDVVLNIDNIPVFYTNRGGMVTYHGRGQKIIYFLLDLRKRNKDVKNFVLAIENLIINVLKEFEILGFIKEGMVGVFVEHLGEIKKIAAIGVKFSRWVSSHGTSLNVNVDLKKFNAIVPCGIKEFGVTSMEEVLGYKIDMAKIDVAILKNIDKFLMEIN